MLRGLLGGYARGRRQTSAATLYLDFLAGLNDSRITYSGGANGTRVNSAGLIVAATTPRFDYNPVTLAARGLLVEEARTNLLLYSQEFEQVNWPRFGTTSITANAATSPDGTNNADLLTFTSAGAGMFQAVVGAASTAYSGTIYMRAAAPVTVNFLLTTNLADPVIVACAVTTTWQRFTVNKTTSIGTTVVAAQVQDSGAGGTNVYLWGAQLEAGSFPTSYIPTTTAAVTRAADSAVMTGADFSSWYNPSQGTFVVTGDRNTAGGSTGVMFGCAETGNFNNSMYASNSSGAGSVVEINYFNGGVLQATVGRNPVNILNPFKLATSYATNDFAGTVDGQSPNTDASGTVPTPMQLLAIGSAPWSPTSAQWNGHIATLEYYPVERPNSLQAMTA